MGESMRLDGKFVLVSGAGRGFGASIAKAMAKEGANVAIHYNSSLSGAEKVAEFVQSLGREAITVQGDITKWSDVKRIADTVFRRFGRLDVVVNNVGDMASEQKSWRDISEEAIDHVLAVDIKGTMLMIHECGTRMLDQEGGGVVVNIGSRVVVAGSPRAPQYAAGKYGIIGLTKSYARAFAPKVRVNAYGPGFIETERLLSRAEWKTGRREEILKNTPLNRIQQPDEAVGPVIFLASDDSRHITGGFLISDGGLSMIGA
jgi:3-oxoacyl-[acyl-carrier protein] reductase